MFDSLIWLCLGLLLMQSSALFERVKLFGPAFIILLGLVLGPFGINALNFGEFERYVTELVLILILFSAGINICWPKFLVAVKPGLLVGVVGILLSFGFGFAATFGIGSPMEEALYIGVALAATSIGLSVPLLNKSGILSTKVGQILLASAIVDDILALYLLSAIHIGLSSDNGFFTVLRSLLFGITGLIFIALMVYAIHFAISKTSFYHQQYPRILFLMIIALASSWATHVIGLSIALGGFVAGASLALRHCEKLKNDSRFFCRLAEYISPLFFLSIGMQITQLDIDNQHLLLLVAVVLTAAMVGKFFCPWVIANKLEKSERRLLGIALVPRGEVGLIVAGIGLQQQHLSNHGMVALVIMTLITTVLATLLIPKMALAVRQVP